MVKTNMKVEKSVYKETCEQRPPGCAQKWSPQRGDLCSEVYLTTTNEEHLMIGLYSEVGLFSGVFVVKLQYNY